MKADKQQVIAVEGAFEHNLKGVSVSIERGQITVITGVSGSGKSSLAFDTILAEAQRRFFYTLSHYSRQFLDLGSRPAVRHISGLSPAISLAQNETQPSRRATVGTLTDISELVAIMLARFGDRYCPTHNLPTSSQSIESILARILNDSAGETIAICAPIAEQKKGAFKSQLSKFAEKGYLKVYVDGELLPLNPLPELTREEKHTIKLIIDHVKIKPESSSRLKRSIETALAEGSGVMEYYVANKQGVPDLKTGGHYSISSGCPSCGYSWPELDSRYFSINSLGKCESCLGFGIKSDLKLEDEDSSDEDEATEDSQDGDHESALEFHWISCPDCSGTGLSDKMRSVKILNKSPHELHLMSLSDLRDFLSSIKEQSLLDNPAFVRVRDEILAKLKGTIQVGLGYLGISRRIRSLSGGESQRLKLAGILTENLRGILYVLDEPSQGLHPAELDGLWQVLNELKNQGNTIIIVDHDDLLMRKADWIIDLGPGGGADGGRIMAKFKPQEARDFAAISLTAKHLIEKWQPKKSSKAKGGEAKFISIHAPSAHNLKMKKVSFLLGGINVVVGVSGAGKSSLVFSTLFPNIYDFLTKPEQGKRMPWISADKLSGLEAINSLSLIDRRPVAKSTVSMPASYLDVFGEIRTLYSSLPDAQIAGLTARGFSLNAAGGRCEECRGRGEVVLKMRFLADARMRCPICNGRRYQSQIQEIQYNGLSIDRVLDLTIDQALDHFKNHIKIVRRLKPASELGLGYLKLGQPSASLSGGEAQRLKIVPHLQKRHGHGSLILLDEPTMGLHFADVERIKNVLWQLAEDGATIVMTEHSSALIGAADWIIDIGPGSAANGGELLFEGTVDDYLKKAQSPTVEYLKNH